MTSTAAAVLPDGDDVMAREALWWAWSNGRPPPQHLAAAEGLAAFEEDEPAPALPPLVAGRLGRSLPYGTLDLLEALPYPHGRIADGPADEVLGHVLVTALGLHRRDPGNVFNDHRAYASVRSRFPVHAFVGDAGGSGVLDVYGHRVADVCGPPADQVGSRLLLSGRWTRLPSAYRWFRGSLVALEAGIALRSVCLAMQLHGLTGQVGSSGAASGERLLEELGLSRTWEWSLPLVVQVPAALPAHPAPISAWARTPGVTPADAPPHPDPVLAQVLEMDRAQSDQELDDVSACVPAGLSDRPGRHWAGVLAGRTSGRMPRGLHGMGGRPGRARQEVLTDSAAWAAVPPPGRLAAAVFRTVAVTAVVQRVDGHVDGVHRVLDGRVELQRAEQGVAARLEAAYGYPLAPGNGCDVRHATVLWFLSVRPRDVVAEHGPGAWTAAQHACGWISHGLGLAASAHGLYARPVRAFQEVPVQRLTGLQPDEMVLLAVICGFPRHEAPVLDLRT